MNGAESLINALAEHGVDACFANPGTSEMQLVAALDKQPQIRAVLCLFEGVVTGAADGYGRMADKPALTLLHLGPGFANGIANLHNAQRAHSPILNMVGDHATDHLQHDAPLTSDIRGMATPVSQSFSVSPNAEALAQTGLQALSDSQSYPGSISTFVVPADHAWTAIAPPITHLPGITTARASDETIAAVAEQLRGAQHSALFLGGRALRAEALYQAGRIAAATGCRLVTETFFARQARGIGRVVTERLAYFGEMAVEQLAGLDTLVLVGAKAPVSFFAYPDKPSVLTPAAAAQCTLTDAEHDALDALTRLADHLSAPLEPSAINQRAQYRLEEGPINANELGKVIANRLPENAIVCDEGATNSLGAFLLTANAAPHDWLTLTGGAIGQGLPLAIGAAIACPSQKIIALEADGSGMYTVQALWTMVREQLDITVMLLNNRSYAILNIELNRVGVDVPGPTALSLLDLSNPDLEWTDIAKGMGMKATKVTSIQALDQAMAGAMTTAGPLLIEVML
ncbi:acetolactate synthase large subunit [Luminiphilus sp.]|nr:acetolactate synthase large subunit [Luminiphilus sp.]MDA8986079.1 acetolactate synthase large subunit [Luminiphilus sp.]MDC1117187.1 acetolactate synthase large subunit [Luminiphilus sp.]